MISLFGIYIAGTAKVLHDWTTGQVHIYLNKTEANIALDKINSDPRFINDSFEIKPVGLNTQ